MILQEKKETEIASMQNLRDETEKMVNDLNAQIEADKIRHDALTIEVSHIGFLIKITANLITLNYYIINILIYY